MHGKQITPMFSLTRNYLVDASISMSSFLYINMMKGLLGQFKMKIQDFPVAQHQYFKISSYSL